MNVYFFSLINQNSYHLTKESTSFENEFFFTFGDLNGDDITDLVYVFDKEYIAKVKWGSYDQVASQSVQKQIIHNKIELKNDMLQLNRYNLNNFSEMSVYNTRGVRLKRMLVSGKKSINLQSLKLSKGLYTITIDNGSLSQSIRWNNL